jgi:hypothetical protein
VTAGEAWSGVVLTGQGAASNVTQVRLGDRHGRIAVDLILLASRLRNRCRGLATAAESVCETSTQTCKAGSEQRAASSRQQVQAGVGVNVSVMDKC